ncbi:hypothetical protein KI387_003604, partial [Taxus chinensis]
MSSCIDFASSASEHLCYVHCNLCSTILAVNVPSNSLFKMVTVRCGHCSHLLSVNMGASVPLESAQNRNDCSKDSASSSSGSGKTSLSSYVGGQATGAPPEKRQRIPSAYNRFIKEEIQRIKANNPDIRHKEAFSAAAKNWAHFPDIHFGLSIERSRQASARK